MNPDIIDCLRLPGAIEPPLVEAFETFDGRVIAGAVVSADRSSWAPVLDGVLAHESNFRRVAPQIAGRSGRDCHPLAAIRWPPGMDINDRSRTCARAFWCHGRPASCRAWDIGNAPGTGRTVVVIGDDSGWAVSSVAAYCRIRS